MNNFNGQSKNSRRRSKPLPYHVQKEFNDIVANLQLPDPASSEAITDGWDPVPRTTTSDPTAYTRVPIGHIAFMGDFESPQSKED
jgi:hypothetical protein